MYVSETHLKTAVRSTAALWLGKTVSDYKWVYIKAMISSIL